jgi:hypothetical protein
MRLISGARLHIFNSLGSGKIQEKLRTLSKYKMTLQFERKYSTQGSGAPCHVYFSFFCGFYGIILPEHQMDPQPESATQPKARGLLHMECDFAIALPYQLRLQDNMGIVEDLQELHSRTLGTTREDFRITQTSAGVLPSAYSTSGSFCHRSVEDPNPVPGTPSINLRLVRVNQDP